MEIPEWVTWPRTILVSLAAVVALVGYANDLHRVARAPAQLDSLRSEVSSLKDTFEIEADRAEDQRALLYCELKGIPVADCFREWEGN